MSANTWIGVDLDRTLAHYDRWRGVAHVGEPIPLMAARVRRWLAEGVEVRIFTARVSGPNVERGECFRDVEEARRVIQDWTERHFGVRLAVTCVKDHDLLELWDDRAVGVVPNTGERA